MTLREKFITGEITAEAYAAGLENDIIALKRAANTPLHFKVSDKGAMSVYGLGRWPVTLYRSQWTRLLAQHDAIDAFLVTHSDMLAEKDQLAKANGVIKTFTSEEIAEMNGQGVQASDDDELVRLTRPE